MFKYNTKCRACDSTELIPVFDLGVQPLANSFRKAEDVQTGLAPLMVMFCSRCSLSQLSIVVDPLILYSNYLYTTSSSQTMQRHFGRLFQDLASEGELKSVVEIGSNDGTCLKFAKQLGYQVMGIEPAHNLCLIANLEAVRTHPDFFNKESAAHAVEFIGHPSVILARHCFAHADDWREWSEALEVLAGPKTVIALEVPYVHDLLARTELDSVYHEHLSYVNLTAISHWLRPTPFDVHRVIRYGIHGGSLLIMLRHKDAKIHPHLSADEYIAEEHVSLEHWQRFSIAAENRIQEVRDMVRAERKNGKRICGFGASAKGTVWINACGFDQGDLLFVSDNSPLKPGTLVPGTRIPVIDQSEFLSEHPDSAVCFAWNFRDEIVKSQKKWIDRGGKFIWPTS